jgi:TolA-binding protein
MIKTAFRIVVAHKRALWIGVLVLGLGATVILGVLARKEKSQASRLVSRAATGEFGDSGDVERFSNLGKAVTTRSEARAKELGDEVQDLKTKWTQSQEALKKLQETHAQEIAALKEQLGRLQVPESSRQVGSDRPSDSQTGPARIRKVSIPPAALQNQTRHVRVPAGSFVRARLLTGVYAPIQGSALPVLLKIESFGRGPNRSTVPIKEAFAVGKAQGDANSARATIQLQTLSLVQPDGKTVEVQVNGYVTDSDGIQGVSGTYVYRTSEIVALAAVTKGLAAGADAASLRNVAASTNPLGGVQRILTGDAAEYAGLQVVGGTLDELSKIVAKRAEQIQPAVFAPNGKEVTLVFLQGVDLPGFAIEEQAVRSPWEGLDVHR